MHLFTELYSIVLGENLKKPVRLFVTYCQIVEFRCWLVFTENSEM